LEKRPRLIYLPTEEIMRELILSTVKEPEAPPKEADSMMVTQMEV